MGARPGYVWFDQSQAATLQFFVMARRAIPIEELTLALLRIRLHLERKPKRQGQDSQTNIQGSRVEHGLRHVTDVLYQRGLLSRCNIVAASVIG
jgi:hypothetical protein